MISRKDGCAGGSDEGDMEVWKMVQSQRKTSGKESSGGKMRREMMRKEMKRTTNK